MWHLIKAWFGLSPDLPFIRDVENPTHGQKAKNNRHQRVVFDANLKKWVMEGNFIDKPPVTITKGK